MIGLALVALFYLTSCKSIDPSNNSNGDESKLQGFKSGDTYYFNHDGYEHSHFGIRLTYAKPNITELVKNEDAGFYFEVCEHGDKTKQDRMFDLKSSIPELEISRLTKTADANCIPIFRDHNKSIVYFTYRELFPILTDDMRAKLETSPKYDFLSQRKRFYNIKLDYIKHKFENEVLDHYVKNETTDTAIQFLSRFFRGLYDHHLKFVSEKVISACIPHRDNFEWQTCREL